MVVRLLLFVAALGLLARTAQAQCTKDTDCKGDRICEQGTCVSPPPAAAPAPCVPAAAEAPVVQPAVAKPPPSERKRLVLIPGVGAYDLKIGRATPSDVLARFGGTPDVRRVKDGRTTKDPDGKVARIAYTASDSTDAPTSTPQVFVFDDRERLQSIGFGEQQRDIEVQGGLRADLPPPELKRLAGEPSRVVTIIPGIVEEWFYDDGLKVTVRIQGRPVLGGMEIIASSRR